MTTKRNGSRALMAAMTTVAALAAAPAVAADGDRMAVEKGREVFLTAGGVGCGFCHGPYAEGNVGIGPYNRGFGEAAIRAALETVEAMRFLRDELTDAQIRLVARYYEWLGRLQLVKSVAKGGRFLPNRIEIHPGTEIQLVVTNAAASPHTFAGEDMGIGPVTVEGGVDMGVVWKAPESEGSFSLKCLDCALGDQELVVDVLESAEKFAPAAVTPQAVIRAERERRATGPERTTAVPDQARIERGRRIFLTVGGVGCVACHGRFAEGDAGFGPYNRGFSATAIRRALKAVEPMAFLFEFLTEADIRDVAAYYESLSDVQLVKVHVVRGLFVPQQVSVHPGTKLQIALFNNGRVPRTFSGKELGVPDVTVPGQEAGEVMWTAPASKTTVSVTCTDCPLRDQALAIRVTRGAAPYVPPVALK